ncbi:MAG: PAS domain S-box-containing protein [Candidatus Azotimanducaceae bacterium]|jgi:PAS domain S-box-containing protein
MPTAITKGASLFQKGVRARRLLPLVTIIIGIALLVGLSLNIAKRMNQLRAAPADNLTWALSQVEVDVLLLLDETLLTRQSRTKDVTTIRRRFDNLYSRTSTLRDAPVFARMRLDDAFDSQLSTLERCLNKLAQIIDGSDQELSNNLDQLINELTRVREEAHQIALTGIGLRSQYSDAERASFGGLLLSAAVVSLALILFLGYLLVAIVRQYRLHQEASDAVGHANARIKSSFDVSLDAIVVANDKGHILEFNEAAEAVFGFSASEAIGADMSKLIIPHHLRAAHLAGMKRFNKTKEPHLVGQGRIEITALRKSGEEFPVEISIGTSSDHRGTIFISYLRDITKRLADEKELKTARDDALAAETAKSNFLAVMSHEMRTPLNGIFGTLELLGNSKVTKKQRSYIDIAKRSGDILLHHVNDVLDISRMDAGKMELVEDSIDLAQFFEDVVTTNETTADARNNTLELRLENLPLVPVLIDERRMRQVVYNLLSNALKFTNKGTVAINVSTETQTDGQPVLNVVITDNGIGIRPEDQKLVFDRFYTQEQSYDRFASGAGLGLAICKNLVEMMGGTIALKSTVGIGTTFTVALPFQISVEKHPTVSALTKLSDISSLRGQDILLVEDNEINRLIVHEMLKSNGMIVHEAHNGQEAVELAQSRKYAAILMDVSMPIMNGMDATRIIRGTSGPNQKTRILGLTAHALAEEQERFIASGMDDCLNKPVSQTTLLNALVTATITSDTIAQKTAHDLIDPATFEGLEQILAPDRLRKLFTDFDLEISTLLQSYALMQNAEDMEALATSTHKSVGSAGMIGAHSFQQELRFLEQAAKAGDTDSAKAHTSAVQLAWPATQAAIRALAV